ncbi:MAG: hypothetical protein AB1757_26745 [Acidobacteriota bacterium]
MKSIRLIKRQHVVQADTKLAVKKPVQEKRAVKNAVEVVGQWAKQRRARQQQSARQMFAALFRQAQVE